MQLETNPLMVEVWCIFLSICACGLLWFLWNKDDAVLIKSHHVPVWQEAREGCGFGYSSTFFAEKAWWQGADGADEVWSNVFKVHHASLMVQASLLSTVKARNKFTLLIFPGTANDAGAATSSPLPQRGDEISAEYESDLLCSCRAFSPPFISLFWAVRAHPTSFWCCFVAMDTMCYCMRHSAVCTAKTILPLQPQQPGYQLKSFIQNNRNDDICLLTTNKVTLLTKAQ